ncbi:MAG: hypothetical protein J0I12_11305 [Candidatus Eremiobacteraeota bacterium]|nr:hypothetical protein [Candidatus Eremiobacteraeota bacterium]
MESYTPSLSPDEFEHLQASAISAGFPCSIPRYSATKGKEPVVGVDFTAETPHPKVTVWRAGADGQEYADVPMATPQDLERLQKEVPLTDAQVDQLARKIAKQMLGADVREKQNRKRIKTNKAAKMARKRNR